MLMGMDDSMLEEDLEVTKKLVRLKIMQAIQKEVSAASPLGSGGGASAASPVTSGYGSTSAPSSSSTATSESRYTLKKLLGKGAFSAVELVHDATQNMDVAKKIGKSGTLDEANKDLEEAQTMIQIKHPNTVHFMRCFLDQDKYGQYQVNIIMEYCAGGDLQGRIEKARAPFDEADVVHVFTSCLKGLDYIHQLRMIHRDIKPGNILLATAGAIADATVKIGDFGLARDLELKSLASQTMTMRSVSGKAGTEVFMAPEVYHGQKYKSTVDIWSLGITMIYTMTLKRPTGVADDPPKVARLLATIEQSAYSVGVKKECRLMVELDASRRPTADSLLLWETRRILLPQVDTVAALLSPHRQGDPVRTASEERTDGCLYQLLQKLKDDSIDHRTKSVISKCLKKAANQAVEMIAAVPSAEVTSVCALFLKSMQAAVTATLSGAGGSGSKELPLHERLKPVKQVMHHFAYTVLRFCTRPMLVDEATVLEKLAQMVIEPASKCMRDAIKGMQEDVRSDTDYFRAQLVELSKHDKAIYSAEFEKRTTGSNNVKLNFDTMCNAIVALADQVKGSNPPPRQQPTGDMLKLMCLCIDALPQFEAVIRSVLAGVERIQLVFRAETKALYRVAEKSLLKGPSSKANGGDGTLLDDASIDCSAVCDVVGCLVICLDFRCMKDVVDRFKALVQSPAEEGAEVYQVKSRWTVGSDGGWRDLMCMLAISKAGSASAATTIICEVQIVLDTMFNARKGMKGHQAYAKFRSFFEMLNFEGLAHNDNGIAGKHDSAAQAEADASAAAVVEERWLLQQEREQMVAAQKAAQEQAVRAEGKRLQQLTREREQEQERNAAQEQVEARERAAKEEFKRRCCQQERVAAQAVRLEAEAEAEIALQLLKTEAALWRGGAAAAAAHMREQEALTVKTAQEHAKAAAAASKAAHKTASKADAATSVERELEAANKATVAGNMAFGSVANDQYTLSDDGTVITKRQHDTYGGAIADGAEGSQPMNTGVHYWKLEILNNGADSDGAHGGGGKGAGKWCFGVCRPGVDLNDGASRWNFKKWFHDRADVWMMRQYNNAAYWELRCTNSRGTGLTIPKCELNAGDEVGMLLDLDHGNLTMYLDGKPCGTIAEGLVGPLYPCIQSCFTGKGVKIHSGPVLQGALSARLEAAVAAAKTAARVQEEAARLEAEKAAVASIASATLREALKINRLQRQKISRAVARKKAFLSGNGGGGGVGAASEQSEVGEGFARPVILPIGVYDVEQAKLLEEGKRLADESASTYTMGKDTLKGADKGKQGGRYLLMSLLGRGGFSEVFKAYDSEEYRLVACRIHKIAQDWSEQKKDTYIKQATRQYEIHCSLMHENVSRLLDIFEIDDDTFCAVLEYCPGNLDLMIKQSKTLSEKDAKAKIVQIVDALKYLNSEENLENPIIHYALKPAHVLLVDDVVKLADFGLSQKARMDDDMSTMELTSQGAGTSWYLPPESFRMHGKDGSPRISSKVDVWSVGVIFYQCLYGRKPFGNDHSQQSFLQQQTVLHARNVDFPETNGSKVSHEAKAFIRRCLTYEMHDRPNALELARDSYILNL